jgi:hypothetical protein
VSWTISRLVERILHPRRRIVLTSTSRAEPSNSKTDLSSDRSSPRKIESSGVRAETVAVIQKKEGGIFVPSYISVSVQDKTGHADGFSTQTLTKDDVKRAKDFLDTFETDDEEKVSA